MLSSQTTVAWMNYYFKLMGDNVPNAKEELHLEPIKKNCIYEEYCADFVASGDFYAPVNMGLFLELWRDVFGYVKIRRFKQMLREMQSMCSSLTKNYVVNS